MTYVPEPFLRRFQLFSVCYCVGAYLPVTGAGWELGDTVSLTVECSSEPSEICESCSSADQCKSIIL